MTTTVSIQKALLAEVVTGAISRVAASTNFFLNMFEMQPGGNAVRPAGGGRTGTYDIFNNTRTVAPASIPGSPAPRVTREKVGRVVYTIPRAHAKLFMSYEELNNLRPIGGPAGTFDTAGVSYIGLQARNLGQKIANFRTASLIGMLRGGLYAHESGQLQYYDFTSTSALWSVESQIPAGNLNQLNMLGSGNILDASWDSPTANVPQQLANINSAFQQLNGGSLVQVVCTHKTWNYLITNDYVVAGGGMASTPFESYERITGTGPDGTPINAFRGRLRAVPWVDFIISDEGLTLGVEGSETFTKLVPEGGAYFLPSITPSLFQMLEGSEVVVEREGDAPTLRTGLYAWSATVADPAGINLYILDNALAAGYVPNAWAYGTVVF